MNSELETPELKSIDDPALRKLLYGWLLFSITSILLAGLFALFIALSRTPVIEVLIPVDPDYMYVGLVGHVVLAFVIWFLAFEGFLWVLSSSVDTRTPRWNYSLDWTALGLAVIGMVLVTVAAFLGLGLPELSNYIPVLMHPVYYAGLGFFATGIALNLLCTLLTLYSAWRSNARIPITSIGMACAGVAAVVAYACFALSGYFQHTTGKAFFDFERFFWGGGHTLQFTNTMAMITAWLYLGRYSFGKFPVSKSTGTGIFIFYTLFVLPAPFIYYVHDTSTQAHKDAFTFLMEWGHGPATVLFILLIAYFIYTSRGVRGLPWSRPGFSSLVLSMAIFLLGGFIALNIRGVNTIIPAHYHCVIGAVTIAYMGVFYEVLPLLKRSLYSIKMARVQPYLYTLGIFLFAAGLFVAGSHGVLRKTYGGGQNLDSTAKYISMGVMGVGGLVAIAGGIYFVVNALGSLLKREETNP